MRVKLPYVSHIASLVLLVLLALALLAYNALPLGIHCSDRPSCPDEYTLLIDSTVVWGTDGGPIMLDRDVFITREGRLEILAETEIQLLKGTVVVSDPAGDMWRAPNIRIEGDLVCDGRQGSIVSFVCSDNMGGDVIIIGPEHGRSEVSINWATGLGFVSLERGDPQLVHCVVEDIHLRDCIGVRIDSCSLKYLHAVGGTGVISHNKFDGRLSLHGDSLHVDHNAFRGVMGDLWGAVTCGNDSRALITNNVIEECGVGILVFSASPEVHWNNLVGNDVTVAILPAFNSPESDTLDFTDNWWDTLSQAKIKDQIEYIENGGVISQKVIQFVPFATEPFEIP